MSEAEHTVSIGEADGKPLLGVTFTTDPMPGWVIIVNLLVALLITFVIAVLVERRRWKKDRHA